MSNKSNGNSSSFKRVLLCTFVSLYIPEFTKIVYSLSSFVRFSNKHMNFPMKSISIPSSTVAVSGIAVVIINNVYFTDEKNFLTLLKT